MQRPRKTFPQEFTTKNTKNTKSRNKAGSAATLVTFVIFVVKNPGAAASAAC